MIRFDDILNLLFPKPDHPSVKNLKQTKDDSLFFESLTRGVEVNGNPGTGKTRWTAGFILDYSLEFPSLPVFIFDASGSLTNDFIGLYHNLERDRFEEIDRRVILDMPGHEELVVPKPVFHRSYGLTNEEMVQRAVEIGKQLNPEKRTETPMMADSLTKTAPMLYRLLIAIKNELGESWQLTEAKKLLVDRYENGQLYLACKQYGEWAGAAKWWFENTLLRSDVSRQDIAAWTSALLGVLSIIETDSLRARYGHYRPGATVKEIIDKGYIYIVNGEKLSNQPDAQAFVFWDEFSSLRTIINKRTPHNPDDKKVLLVIDEVYRLFEIPGMAKALGEVSTYFRSRKLMPMIIIQSFWQLDDKLKQQIWNLGNIVSFAMDNFNDAYTIAQQLFTYNPTQTKFDAPSDRSNPTAEPDRGQYLTEANWIQNLGSRQMVMRRYLDEKKKEKFVSYIEATRDRPLKDLPIEDVKEDLLKRRTVSVREALKEVNSRRLTIKKEATKRPTI